MYNLNGQNPSRHCWEKREKPQKMPFFTPKFAFFQFSTKFEAVSKPNLFTHGSKNALQNCLARYRAFFLISSPLLRKLIFCKKMKKIRLVDTKKRFKKRSLKGRWKFFGGFCRSMPSIHVHKISSTVEYFRNANVADLPFS